MKKALLFFVSIVMMVFAASTLSSCSKEETSIVLSVGAEITYSSNVTPETEKAIEDANKRIDERLNNIFGKTFNVKCDSEGNVDDATMNKYNKRIDDDSNIESILKEIAQLKDKNGNGAVKYVTFVFYSGTATIWKFIID